MPDYNIIKYCRLCKKRFVVAKGENRIIFCADCRQKYREQQEREAKEEAAKGEE